MKIIGRPWKTLEAAQNAARDLAAKCPTLLVQISNGIFYPDSDTAGSYASNNYGWDTRGKRYFLYVA